MMSLTEGTYVTKRPGQPPSTYWIYRFRTEKVCYIKQKFKKRGDIGQVLVLPS